MCVQHAQVAVQTSDVYLVSCVGPQCQGPLEALVSGWMQLEGCIVIHMSHLSLPMSHCHGMCCSAALQLCMSKGHCTAKEHKRRPRASQATASRVAGDTSWHDSLVELCGWLLLTNTEKAASPVLYHHRRCSQVCGILPGSSWRHCALLPAHHGADH
jgi:hypothetical protein